MKNSRNFLKLFFIVIFSFVLLGFSGCRKKIEPQSEIAQKSYLTTPIPREVVERLVKEGDHIDYSFIQHSLSMSQDGNSAIYQDLSHLSAEPILEIPETCTPLARKIYLGNGEIIIEANLYFAQGCVFQVFILNEKPLYSNTILSTGIAFYTDLLQKINVASQSATQ